MCVCAAQSVGVVSSCYRVIELKPEHCCRRRGIASLALWQTVAVALVVAVVVQRAISYGCTTEVEHDSLIGHAPRRLRKDTCRLSQSALGGYCLTSSSLFVTTTLVRILHHSSTQPTRPYACDERRQSRVTGMADEPAAPADAAIAAINQTGEDDEETAALYIHARSAVPGVVIIDRINKQSNIGGIVRSASAFGVNHLCFVGPVRAGSRRTHVDGHSTKPANVPYQHMTAAQLNLCFHDKAIRSERNPALRIATSHTVFAALHRCGL